MAYKTYNCDSLTGSAERSLDVLSVADLVTGYRAIVSVGGELSYFVYSSTGTAAEQVVTPPRIVRPDDYATGGNWVEDLPGAIGEAGHIIRGKNREIFKTANADSPLTAVQCAGTIVNNYGMTDADCTIDLPTAVEGLSFVCILPTVRSHFFKLHCPTAQADKIYLLGVAGSDDGNVGVASGYATGTAASFFTFMASDGGYDWFCIPIFGTWVAS